MINTFELVNIYKNLEKQMTDELTLDMSKTYIYDGLEYILTGRTAKKHKGSSDYTQRRSKRKAALTANSNPIMVEIQLSPKITVQHPSPPSTEKKWVELNDLYMVDDMLDEPDEDELIFEEFDDDDDLDHCGD